MAARESTRVHRKYKTKYCVTNWRESRYRRQGAVENLFFRYKRALGDSPSCVRLRIPEARGDDRVQRIEPDG